jgi:branched-subunit amino acid transport protein
MSDSTLWILVITLGLMSFALRASFILLQDRIQIPELLRRGLTYVPAAVIGAIFAPILLPLGEPLDLAVQIPRWGAALVAILIALRTANLIVVLLAGMATLWLLQALIS